MDRHSASAAGVVASEKLTGLTSSSVSSGFESEAHALRAGYAIRAAVDLALLDAGVPLMPYGPYWRTSPTSDQRWRLASREQPGGSGEHYQEPFLRSVLEERVLPHEASAGDALLELGLDSLRAAFEAPTGDATLEQLHRAEELFDGARAEDEDRPDARAFAAACRAVAAFGSDETAIAAALDELADARTELERYTPVDPTGSVALDRSKASPSGRCSPRLSEVYEVT